MYKVCKVFILFSFTEVGEEFESAASATLRALDTWPYVAAPRAEDAESDGGQTIALLGAGPFQDLQRMPL